MVKKYELTEETKTTGDITLYRIKALKDFGNVSAGKLGGFVQSEDNLSQDDDAWVFNNAKVYGNAQVSGNVEIKELADDIVFKNWWSSGRYLTWTKSNNM